MREEDIEMAKISESLDERFNKDEITEGEIYSELTRLACKKGFDLFQLLEEDFCIDEKTIKYT